MAGASYSGSSQWYGGRASARAVRGGMAGLNKAARRLRALSVPRAPLDRGPLRESAAVHEATDIDAPASAVSYGTPYAVRQHEELDYNHTNGGAKYLEGPLTENRRELMGLIAEGVRNELHG